MESIAILVIEKGRARVMRFRVELSGEASWSLASHSLAEALKRGQPDLVTIVESEDQARWLADELRSQGRAKSVIFLHPDGDHTTPGQNHISLRSLVDPTNPKQLVLDLAQALLDSQGREPLNPLSGLPGVGLLKAEVEHQIAENKIFTFLYLDLDNFKAYNDFYGFARGDDAIRLLAALTKQAIAEHGSASDIAVHIGGDDFGILTVPAKAALIAETLRQNFDAKIIELYDEPERAQGYIVTLDRRGKEARYPIMTISIAGVSNQQRKIVSYLQLSEIAAEIKGYAKLVTGSIFVSDRRSDPPDKAGKG